MEKAPTYDPVRMLAWEILQRVERTSAFSDLLLNQTFSRCPDLKVLDRAFISELVLGALRWQARLDHLIRRELKKEGPSLDPRVLHLLRMGAYQILFLDRVPDSAAVNESVRLAKAVFRSDKIAGFVNAILRSVSRHKDGEAFPSFQERPVEHISIALSHPSWLVERWVEDYGPETARRICEANNRRPPVTVRTNTLRISREDLKRKFGQAGIPALPGEFSSEALILEKTPLLPEDPFFQAGLYFLQDEASQMIGHILGPQEGERILDACAAPGGKTTHLAQLMRNRGEIFALDLHSSKIRFILENCARLGISMVRSTQADATQPLPFPPGEAFDRILLDAPCTGLGILHRHPEAKWRRRPEDLLRLQSLQKKIIENVSLWLKPGGILVYSTCTMTREENDSVVEAFLGKHPDFELEDLRSVLSPSHGSLVDERGFFRTYPGAIIREEAYRMDGFFAARLKRTT